VEATEAEEAEASEVVIGAAEAVRAVEEEVGT